MIAEAAETLVPKSVASFGSIGSTQRSEIPALNPASASRRIASRACDASLGRKPLDAPGTVHAAAFACVQQPVVQPVGAALPEFDRLRHDAVAAPVRWPRRALAVALARLFHRFFENFPGRYGFALLGSPGREARAERPGGEIVVGVLRADLFHAALDAHLALELRPQEHQARGGARFTLAALAAAVIGMEHEAAALDALQQ